jgi:hypothetical protein
MKTEATDVFIHYTLGWLDYLIADMGSGLFCLVLAGWLIKQGMKR